MKEKSNANLHGSGIVNVSLDLGSRQMAVTMDGIIIPATEVFLDKFVVEGEQFISFSYTIETKSDNGMRERRQFFLPRPEDGPIDSLGELNESGLASRVVFDDKKAKADVIDYLKRDNKPE